MFPFLTAFMVFIVVLAILRARTTKNEKERSDAFWRRESEANSARKIDLSTLTYFTFDTNALPLPPEEDPELLQLHREIQAASEKKMLNLNGISNTDLKLQYGPQNLEELTVYGDNFSALENAILSYGIALHDKNHLSEAITVLEKGLLLPTDLTGNYLKLANYYEEKGTLRKIRDLITLSEKNLTGFARDSVGKHLSTILEKAEPPENIDL